MISFFVFSTGSGRKEMEMGAFSGVLHVTFAIWMHFLLFSEIILRLTGVDLTPFLSSEIPGRTKFYTLIIALFIMIIVWPFYRRNRIKRLLKLFNQKYGNDKGKNIMRALLYTIVPMVLVTILAVIRQGGLK